MVGTQGSWKTRYGRVPIPRGRRARLVKSTLIVGIVGLLLVTLSACSSGGSPKAGARQTLVVWQFWSGFAPNLGPAVKALDQGFESRYPQYKIDDVPVAYSELPTKLSAAIAAGAGPNIVSGFPGVPAAQFKNGLAPLQSYLTASDKKTWENMGTAASPGGNIYIVPWTQYGTFFYYNKKLFTKAGLNPNDPPTTWAEFLHDCQALKNHGTTALSGGFADGYQWEWYAYPLLDQLMSKTTTKRFLNYDLSIDGPPFTTAWADIKALGTDGYFAKDAASLKLFNDSYTEFEAGKAAMTLDEGFLANLKAAQQELGTNNVGVFPVPRLAGSQSPPFVDAGPEEGWGITKWTKDKAAAWDYVSWMESPQAAAIIWKMNVGIPSNTEFDPPSSNPAIRTILSDLRNPLNHSVYTGFSFSVLAIDEKYASEMYSGTTSISSVLQMMEQLQMELAPKLK